MRLTLALSALLLTSCAAPIGRLNPGAVEPYTIVTSQEMAAASLLRGREYAIGLCGRDGIRELHAGADDATAPHECAHLADQRGITYREAIRRLTPPGPINEHMAKRLAAMQRVADRGGDPWQALKDIYGAAAVQHPEILARLK